MLRLVSLLIPDEQEHALNTRFANLHVTMLYQQNTRTVLLSEW